MSAGLHTFHSEETIEIGLVLIGYARIGGYQWRFGPHQFSHKTRYGVDPHHQLAHVASSIHQRKRKWKLLFGVGAIWGYIRLAIGGYLLPSGFYVNVFLPSQFIAQGLDDFRFVA